MINLKRAYEAASPADGLRILVERLWPRGVEQTKGEDRPLAERSGPKHRTPQVVRPRPGTVAAVSEAVFGRIEGSLWPVGSS